METKKLSSAIDEAKRLYQREQERADELETELEQAKIDRNEYMTRHTNLQIEHSALEIANAELQAKYDALQLKFDSETARLRNSRAACVSRERGIKDGIIKGCQYIFNKVKSFLKDNTKAEELRSLYFQAKGTREVLERVCVENEDALPYLAASIDKFQGVEEKYKAQADLMDVTELTEDELVVPLVVDGVPLEAQADVDQYGSNDGLVMSVGQLLLETASSQPTGVDPASVPPTADP